MSVTLETPEERELWRDVFKMTLLNKGGPLVSLDGERVTAEGAADNAVERYRERLPSEGAAPPPQPEEPAGYDPATSEHCHMCDPAFVGDHASIYAYCDSLLRTAIDAEEPRPTSAGDPARGRALVDACGIRMVSAVPMQDHSDVRAALADLRAGVLALAEVCDEKAESATGLIDAICSLHGGTTRTLDTIAAEARKKIYEFVSGQLRSLAGGGS